MGMLDDRSSWLEPKFAAPHMDSADRLVSQCMVVHKSGTRVVDLITFGIIAGIQ